MILKWHGRGSRAGEIADLLKLPEALVQSVIDNPPQDKDRFKVQFVEHCRAGDVSNEETSERRGFREKRAETPEREPCGK